VYIGIDDTDSRQGMCTTYLVKVIAEKIMDMGLDLIGPPRLVRLNPNIPWKTRGNGAVCIRVGKGYGKREIVGEIKGKKIYAYKYGKSKEVDIEEIIKAIKDYFVLEEKNTNPGIVFSPTKLPEKLYWKAVRGVVSKDYVKKILDESNANFFEFKNGRGIIGASAAIAWRARRYTYELLTYLPEEKWNAERFVDEKSVIDMDKKTKWTFDNYDYENRYIAIKPNSKTPVLYGIRGLNPKELIKAKDMVKSTNYNSWFLFLTNQGTDEHLIRKKIREIEENENVIVEGIVTKAPRKIEGGHVVFQIEDKTGKIDCTAYEPTKNFRKIIENLREGDTVEVYGSVRSEPRTINIEKIRIIKLEEIKVKIANPICPKCGKRMESIGKGKGYRCRKCGIKLPEEVAEYKVLEREIKEGWYEVPVIARRHLSKPIKIMQLRSFKIF
jgi:tRNA(Ile2)-agmatinylcytidine synthase